MPVTRAHSAGNDALTASGLPLFFEIGNFKELGCALPQDRGGQTVRVWARSLTVMQKEAVAYAARSGKAWRLASDEGPYLQGHDVGPCPLAFLTSGMICSFMNEITAALARAGVTVHSLELVQDNHYTMEGSALAGTMVGRALPVALEVRLASDARIAELEPLLAQAVQAAPVDGLLRGAHRSLFTLTHNGLSIAPAHALALEVTAPEAPRTVLERIIQDTHFSVGHLSGSGASDNNGRSGSFDPVETHLYLDSGEDDDFARACLDMGEQTCYLHALCQTPLHTNLSVRHSNPIP